MTNLVVPPKLAIPWDQYYGRLSNRRSRPERATFWRDILAHTQAQSVLEAGCGNGLNLEHINVPVLYGVDTYLPAMTEAHERVKVGTAFTKGDVRDLPFLDESFDLTFCCTVLIHLPDDDDVDRAIRELMRISRKWVLVMEYDAPERTPVAWRGSKDGIVKRPWEEILKRHMILAHIEGRGLLTDAEGFDNVSWWLVRRP